MESQSQLQLHRFEVHVIQEISMLPWFFLPTHWFYHDVVFSLAVLWKVRVKKSYWGLDSTSLCPDITQVQHTVEFAQSKDGIKM